MKEQGGTAREETRGLSKHLHRDSGQRGQQLCVGRDQNLDTNGMFAEIKGREHGKGSGARKSDTHPREDQPPQIQSKAFKFFLPKRGFSRASWSRLFKTSAISG